MISNSILLRNKQVNIQDPEEIKFLSLLDLVSRNYPW